MDSVAIEQGLQRLFRQWAGVLPEIILPLAPSGSDRIYYRLQHGDRSAIGTYSPLVAESRAFLQFSRHFKSKRLPVPEIYAEATDQTLYLQEDLGSTTLYSFLPAPGVSWPGHLTMLYRQVVRQLANLQIKGAEGFDFNWCYPKSTFDRQSMQWDLNAFKYYFLQPVGVTFDERLLAEDYDRLIDFLLEADDDYFMFRDFQTRNIMIREGAPYFIDYQGGRQGALQYDLASLLFQARARIAPETRAELLEAYLEAARAYIALDATAFTHYYYGFVLIRSLQVLGAYGFRGLYQRKEHFLKSIPPALDNIRWLLNQGIPNLPLPHLNAYLKAIVSSAQFEPFDRNKGKASTLTVRIHSFSYKKSGIPRDTTGNGGGFVFDCRFLHNPGRYETYKHLTGRDEPVINFLRQHTQMPYFLEQVYRIVDDAIENYIARSFTSLVISFGCTGGQHRSVYAADALAKHVREKYGVDIQLEHVEQGIREEITE